MASAGSLIRRAATVAAVNSTTSARCVAELTARAHVTRPRVPRRPFEGVAPLSRRREDKEPGEAPSPLQKGSEEGLISLAPSPVKLLPLLRLLHLYPDKTVATYLSAGFSEGFLIPYTGDRVATTCGNLKSARLMPEVVADKIAKECTGGRPL